MANVEKMKAMDAPDISFADARTAMRYGFAKDPVWRKLYQSNIALLVWNMSGEISGDKCSEIADEIIKMIFGEDE